MASLREHRQPGVRRIQSPAAPIPLADRCAEMVICSWVFEHLNAPRHVFTEIERVLKPGGCAVFITPHVRSVVVGLNRVLRPLQGALVPRLYGRAEADTFPVRYRANARRQIMMLAADAGLQVSSLRFVEDPSYLAFSPWLFKASVLLGRITPPVHMIGVLERA
jgi:SAM-dependent methyltransferase